MTICSLVHEGESNLSLSRIQVMQNILRNWPEDIKIAQCRQCANPLCIQACPNRALHVDATHGNIRIIDKSLCDGCKKCINACPYIPSRIIWNPATAKALKCDFCLNAPYWKETGGPNGKQACVEICPQKAIQVTKKIPDQQGVAGYDVNLRKEV